MHENSEITTIGITNYRSTNQKFGIKDADRLQHLYIIGKTGVGKTTLMASFIRSDIRRGNGLCLLDPHGDISEEIMRDIPEERKEDVIYFNPKDLEHPVVFNPLKAVHPNYHHLVASGLISTFKKIWSESWGPRMEHILRFTLLTLLCYPDATLLDIQPLLTDDTFRAKVLPYVMNRHIINFWKNEFEQYSKTLRNEAISPILNKTGIFLASVSLRHTVGQKTRGIRIQEVMDKRKILICNLSKGQLGEDASAILGCIMLTQVQLAAMYRARLDPHLRTPFYVYIDEMQNYMTLSFADMLAEGRKFGISLFMAHQYIEQLDERIRNAIFGNVGTIISFRVGARDAEYLAKEFYPVFDEEDLVSLPRFSMYLKLMIDGTASEGFSAQLSKPLCPIA